MEAIWLFSLIRPNDIYAPTHTHTHSIWFQWNAIDIFQNVSISKTFETFGSLDGQQAREEKGNDPLCIFN